MSLRSITNSPLHILDHPSMTCARHQNRKLALSVKQGIVSVILDVVDHSLHRERREKREERREKRRREEKSHLLNINCKTCAFKNIYTYICVCVSVYRCTINMEEPMIEKRLSFSDVNQQLATTEQLDIQAVIKALKTPSIDNYQQYVVFIQVIYRNSVLL